MTLAKAFVTGVVVKPPEKRFTPNDLAIASFTINIDKNNETLLRVTAFGQMAEYISSNIGQGDYIAADGRLQAMNYTLPNGKEKKIYEINANTVEKLDSNFNSSTNSIKNTNTNTNENLVSLNQEEITEDLIDEDEIPF